MINRFKRIKSEFGNKEFYKTLLLIIGLMGMSLIPIYFLKNYYCILAVIIGLITGFIFRKTIMNMVEIIPRITSTGLFVYGIVLTIGDYMGLDAQTKLLIITITTVVVFNFKFWILSDENIYNTEKYK